MPFDLMSSLLGIVGGIFLALILKIISKIKNRNRNSRSDAVVAPLGESQYIQPHPNPPFDTPQGITPKPIFENDGEGGTIKRFIRG
jgi:hypothetical protein